MLQHTATQSSAHCNTATHQQTEHRDIVAVYVSQSHIRWICVEGAYRKREKRIESRGVSGIEVTFKKGGWQSLLQCVAACCSVLQCVAVCCGVLQCVAVCSGHQQGRCHSLLWYVAVCCGVLQCVAACCSVLQRVQATQKADVSREEDGWIDVVFMYISVYMCVNRDRVTGREYRSQLCAEVKKEKEKVTMRPCFSKVSPILTVCSKFGCELKFKNYSREMGGGEG